MKTPGRGEHCRQKEQQVQRPWSGCVPHMLKEQQGGPCGWSRVSKREGETKLETRA